MSSRLNSHNSLWVSVCFLSFFFFLSFQFLDSDLWLLSKMPSFKFVGQASDLALVNTTGRILYYVLGNIHFLQTAREAICLMIILLKYV